MRKVRLGGRVFQKRVAVKNSWFDVGIVMLAYVKMRLGVESESFAWW